MSNFIVDPFNSTQGVNLVQNSEPIPIEEYDIAVAKLPRGNERTTYEIVIGDHTLHFQVDPMETGMLEGIYPDKAYKRRVLIRHDGRTAVRQPGFVPVLLAVEESPGATTFLAVQATLHEDDA